MSHRLRIALAAGFGAAVALGPMIAADWAVRRVAIEAGRAELSGLAGAMVSHSDRVLDHGAQALASLARGGVSGCAGDDLRFITEEVAARPPLKEIGVMNDRALACSNLGGAAALSRGDAMSALGGAVSLSMVEAGSPARAALGLARRTASGAGHLAALIGPSALVPEIPPLPGRHGRLELADGTPIGGFGETADGMVEARRASARFPVVAVAAAEPAVLIAPFARLAAGARILGALIGVVLLVLVAGRLRTALAEADARVVPAEPRRTRVATLARTA